MMNLEHPTQPRNTHSAPRIQPRLPQHLGQLLHQLSDAFELRILDKCRQRGHRKFRCSHSAVISHLDGGAMCLGALAERIGISQQATGKLVRDLERAGYLYSHPDIRDKRSRIIQLTPAGAALQSDIVAALHEVHDEFEGILGDSGLQNFEQQLRHAATALTGKIVSN